MHKPVRLSGRLYFFPAFLPLAELLPWVITLIGAVAGVAGFSLPKFWARHRTATMIFMTLCLATAAGVIIYTMPDKEVRTDGTRAIAAANLPKPLVHSTTQATPISYVPQNTFRQLWTRRVSTQILATPVIENNIIIYGAYNGTTEAVSINDGTPLWSLPQKAPVFAVSQDGKGTIYSSEGLHDTPSSSLTAIDPVTGHVKWQREFLGHLEENAAFFNHARNMLVSAGPGGLWALRTANGDVLWHQAVGHIDSEPLVFDGTVYVPAQIDEKTHKTIFYALNAATGKILWSLPQPGQPWGSPIIDKSGTVILTTTGDGQIGIAKPTDTGWAQAVSRDGKPIWQTELPSTILQPGAYLPEKDLIVHSLKNGEIVALNTKDGSVAWRFNTGGILNTSATLITGFAVPMLAITTYDGLLSVIRATDGALLTRQKITGQVNAAPVVQGDILYAFSAYDIFAFGGLHTLAEQK